MARRRKAVLFVSMTTMVAGVGGLLGAQASCTPFGNGSTTTTTDGGSVSSSDASGRDRGPVASLGDATAPVSNCLYEEVFFEPFDNKLLNGWQRESKSGGTFDVITDETDGPTPKHSSYATVSVEPSIIDPKVENPAAITRMTNQKVTAARIVFDLAHRSISNYTEFGCSLMFFHDSGAQRKSAHVYMRYDGTGRLVFDGLVLIDGNAAEGVAGKQPVKEAFPINAWKTLTFDMEIVEGGQIEASVKIDGDRAIIPRFDFGLEVESVGIACGITYTEPHEANRLSEVAIDDLRFSICPVR